MHYYLSRPKILVLTRSAHGLAYLLEIWLGFYVCCMPIIVFSAPLLMRSFTSDRAVIDVGVSYRIDVFVLPIYMMLFAINSFLQALKRPIWTLLIGIYRQAFGVAFWLCLYLCLGLWRGWCVVWNCHKCFNRHDTIAVYCQQVALPLVGGIFSGQKHEKPISQIIILFEHLLEIPLSLTDNSGKRVHSINIAPKHSNDHMLSNLRSLWSFNNCPPRSPARVINSGKKSYPKAPDCRCPSNTGIVILHACPHDQYACE